MLFLHLPHRLAGKQDPIHILLRHSPKFIPLFALRSQELRFSRIFLETFTNYWLFRCNQKKYLGDFIIVDMSSPALHLRQAWVVELKFRQSVQLRKGFQLRNSQLAIEQLTGQGIISNQSPISYLHGGGMKLIEYWKEPILSE